MRLTSTTNINYNDNDHKSNHQTDKTILNGNGISSSNGITTTATAAATTTTATSTTKYQSIQLTEVPNDHYLHDNNNTMDPQNTLTGDTKRRWLIYFVSMILFVRIVMFFGTGAPTSSQHDEDLDTTIQQFYNDSNDNNHKIRTNVLEILYNLNKTLSGRVWIRDIDSADEYKVVARVWRQDCTIVLPMAVIEVLSETDVQITVPILAQIATNYQIPFRIRSGGHSKAGYSTVPNGIVVSLKHMTKTQLLIDDHDDTNNNSSTKTPPTTAATTAATTAVAIIQPGATVEIVLDTFITGTIPDPGAVPTNGTTTTTTSTVVEEGGYGGAVGQCGKVAEGGWVLGGGVGSMSRLLGLGIDNVLEFTIVLANGTKISCSSQQHIDLFWALRGAGSGNFGIVTSMKYRVHKNVPDRQLIRKLTIPLLQMGNLLYELGNSNTNNEFMLIVGGRQQQQSSIDNNNSTNIILALSFMTWFTINSSSIHSETLDYANNHYETVIQPMIKLSSSSSSSSSEILQSSTTTGDDQQQQQQQKDKEQYPYNDTSYETFYWSESTHDFSDHGGYSQEVYAAQPWQGFLMPVNNTLHVWDTILRIMYQGMLDCPDLQPHIEYWGGSAISTIPSNATAFPYRQALYNVGVLLVVQDSDTTSQQRFQQQVDKINVWWPDVAYYLTGSYLNYPMNSLSSSSSPDDYAQLYWGDNRHKLQQIKQKYDPLNVFNYEQSIPPL